MIASDASYRTLSTAGVPGASRTVEEAARLVVALARRGEAADVHLCGPYTLALAARDPHLAATLGAACLILPEGSGGEGLTGGPELLRQVCARDVRESGAAGLRHYLVGATPGPLARLARELTDRYPGLRLAGTECPARLPLTEDERAAQTARVRGRGAQLVWIGLGTPRAHGEAARLAAGTGAVTVAVGAAFEALAGERPHPATRRLWRRLTPDRPGRPAPVACPGAGTGRLGGEVR